MTNKILKLILLGLTVVFLIALFIFISTLKDKKLDQGKTQLPASEVTVIPTGGAETITSSVKGFFLTVTSPGNNSTQSSKYLTVKGKTVANADIFVNDKEGKVNANGDFSINTILDEGQNTVLIMVNDASGNFLEKELTVTVASFQ